MPLIIEARDIKKEKNKRPKVTGAVVLLLRIVKPVKSARRIKMPDKSGYTHFLWYRKVYAYTTAKIVH